MLNTARSKLLCTTTSKDSSGFSQDLYHFPGDTYKKPSKNYMRMCVCLNGCDHFFSMCLLEYEKLRVVLKVKFPFILQFNCSYFEADKSYKYMLLCF